MDSNSIAGFDSINTNLLYGSLLYTVTFSLFVCIRFGSVNFVDGLMLNVSVLNLMIYNKVTQSKQTWKCSLHTEKI